MSRQPATTPVPTAEDVFSPPLTPAAQDQGGRASTAGPSGEPTQPVVTRLPPAVNEEPPEESRGAETGVEQPHRPITNNNERKAQSFALPRLRLEIRELSHPGSALFLSAVDVAECMAQACRNVLHLLYVSPPTATTHVPPIRSVTLVLKPMDGVAYTTSNELDNDHKEIHFSLGYIEGMKQDRRQAEITGVLTHELVHCFQHNGKGACDGGLIEGIADWVRLRCNLAPPHWRRTAEGKWNDGYERTAYFLEHLCQRFGSDTMQRLNEKLRTGKYKDETFWIELLGHGIDQLWHEYAKNQEKEEPR